MPRQAGPGDASLPWQLTMAQGFPSRPAEPSSMTCPSETFPHPPIRPFSCIQCQICIIPDSLLLSRAQLPLHVLPQVFPHINPCVATPVLVSASWRIPSRRYSLHQSPFMTNASRGFVCASKRAFSGRQTIQATCLRVPLSPQPSGNGQPTCGPASNISSSPAIGTLLCSSLVFLLHVLLYTSRRCLGCLGSTWDGDGKL